MTDQTAATTSMKGGGYYSQSTRGAKDVIDNAAPMLLEAGAALPEPVPGQPVRIADSGRRTAARRKRRSGIRSRRSGGAGRIDRSR